MKFKKCEDCVGWRAAGPCSGGIANVCEEGELFQPRSQIRTRMMELEVETNGRECGYCQSIEGNEWGDHCVFFDSEFPSFGVLNHLRCKACLDKFTDEPCKR